MDDLRALTSLLSTPKPALSAVEQSDLEKVLSTVSASLRKKEFNKPIEPIVNYWLEKPGEFKVGNVQLDVPDQPTATTIITVSPDKKGNDIYPTILEAVTNAKDLYTIKILKGTYSEQITIRKNLHFISEGASFSKCRFSITSSNVSMKGFEFICESETFNISKSTLHLIDCNVKGSGVFPVIAVENSSRLLLKNTTLNTPFIFNANNGSIINALKSVFSGSIRAGKSDLFFDSCQISNLTGPGIDINSSTLKLVNSKIINCSDFGVCASNKCINTIENCEFDQIKGAGIWLQTMSQLTGKNVYFTNCEKSGICFSTNSGGEFKSVSITKCPNYGIELQTQSNCTFHELWLSEIGKVCIQGDLRSNFILNRCNLVKSQGVAVNLSNGSTVRASDTFISESETYNIFLSNSDFFGSSCEISKAKKDSFMLKDGSRVELTSCNILNNGGNGILALDETKVSCNNCFFIDNQLLGVSAQKSLLIKMIGASFTKNGTGGVNIALTDLLQIDRCRFTKNSLLLSQIKQGVVRQSLFVQAWTKVQQSNKHVEINLKSNVVIEDNMMTDTILYIRNSKAVIRRNEISKTRATAIICDDYADLNIDGNTFSHCSLVLLSQDHCNLLFNANIIENVANPKKVDPTKQTQISFRDEKRKAILIKKFSQSTIENNVLAGDYDYSIFIDSQSLAHIKSNRIQSGTLGCVVFTGVSSGSCIDNTFSGSFKDNPVDFHNGCTEIRR